MLKSKLLFALSTFVTTAVYAGESVDALIKAGIAPICAPFAAQVSKSEGSFGTKSKFGCLGAFQFCPGTFQLYYQGTEQEFLKSPPDQVTAWNKYMVTQWELVKKHKLDALVKQTVEFDGRTAVIDASAILMACQFGCGKYGKLANYARSKNCNDRKVKDGNLVSVCRYLIRGAGFDVPCFTGVAMPTPAATGVSSPVSNPGSTTAAATSCVSDGKMEIAIKDIHFRFDANSSVESIKKVLELLK
ncbi:acyltransferase [Sinorhizobium meliloti]|uniref:acyltransferase n=1 Tax=Rhizobium meliloti TaxID=382 RepID=UPI000FDB1A53|nr:acyltransferase [Sinorhizobium meliloti]MQX03828.1 acyltransferase [Sinorhizobium meliloti]RVK46517.1 acyltransferase [Sinorhizobium meliloti]